MWDPCIARELLHLVDVGDNSCSFSSKKKKKNSNGHKFDNLSYNFKCLNPRYYTYVFVLCKLQITLLKFGKFWIL